MVQAWRRALNVLVLLAPLLACGGERDGAAEAHGASQGSAPAGPPPPALAPAQVASDTGGVERDPSPPTAGAAMNLPRVVQPMNDAAVGPAGAPPTGAPDAAMDGAPDGPAPCAPRPVEGDATIRFHHVHFNTVDATADLDFFERYLDAPAMEFCRPEGSGAPVRATRTERGYFLYTAVDSAPDATLNTYLEHVGWLHRDPNAELARLVDLDAPLFPAVRFQCPEAFAGEMACLGYWFYLVAPSGARIEIARGPGPAVSGFGHVHMIGGVDFGFFEVATDGVLGEAAANRNIDEVNHTTASLPEGVLSAEEVVETRGKPIDHIAYSTTDLEAERTRIEAAGLAIAEDIAFRPGYGFRSFFLKSPKGIWVEIVEDSPFN